MHFHRTCRRLGLESLETRDYCAANIATLGPAPLGPLLPALASTTQFVPVNPPTTPGPVPIQRPVNPPMPEITVEGVIDNQAEPVYIGWGYTTNPAWREFRVQNDGQAPLVITNITAPMGFVLTNGAPRTLAPGQFFILRVTLQATAGEKNGTLAIYSNDRDESKFDFNVWGREFAPPVYSTSDKGLLHPDAFGVFYDRDTRPATKIEIAPPTGNVPKGTKYVVFVELAGGQKLSYAIGDNPTTIAFFRRQPPVFRNFTNLRVEWIR